MRRRLATVAAVATPGCLVNDNVKRNRNSYIQIFFSNARSRMDDDRQIGAELQRYFSPLVISSYLFLFFYYEQSYLSIYWTDFHNLCIIW